MSKSSAIIIMYIYTCVVLAAAQIEWLPATASWYGTPNGAGSDSGSCGYENLVNTPYGSDVVGVSHLLFKNGIGCGTCYEVKCTENELCARQPVRVVVTDDCTGYWCSGRRIHFDMSGSAFGKLANRGGENKLRNHGFLNILYRRVRCSYNSPLVFQVAKSATPSRFEVQIRYVDGPGDLNYVELQQANSLIWQPMRNTWGANWVLNGPLTGPNGPMSIRLTSLTSGQKIVAKNVIPAYWIPGHSYRASVYVNFDK